MNSWHTHLKHIMYTYHWQVVGYTYVCIYLCTFISWFLTCIYIYIFVVIYIYICIYIYIYAHPPHDLLLIFKSKCYHAWYSVHCCFCWCIYAVFLYCLYFSRNHCIFEKKNLMILWSCLFYGNAFFAFIVFIPESFQFHNIHFKHVELRI